MSESMIGSYWFAISPLTHGYLDCLLVLLLDTMNHFLRETNGLILETTPFFGSIHGYPNVLDTPIIPAKNVHLLR